jgi:hypothetical protein
MEGMWLNGFNDGIEVVFHALISHCQTDLGDLRVLREDVRPLWHADVASYLHILK